MGLWKKLVSLIFGTAPKDVEIQVHGRPVRGKLHGKNERGLNWVSYRRPDGFRTGKWLPDNEFKIIESR